MILTVGDTERLKAAMEKQNLTVNELLAIINNKIVCDDCEYKKNVVQSSGPSKEQYEDDVLLEEM